MASHDKPKDSLCSLCKEELRPEGPGCGLYTSECSHTFHFLCVSDNIKNGHQECPVCKVPWSAQLLQLMRIPLTPAKPAAPPNRSPFFQPNLYESAPLFDDDEPVDHHAAGDDHSGGATGGMEIRTYTEYPGVERGESRESLTVLIHLRAPSSPVVDVTDSTVGADQGRASLDLVAVLDVSYSMVGTKLALLKRAMDFVVDCLGPNDRLSIVSFSTTAARVLPLRRMTESGRVEARRAVDALSVVADTSIAEGLGLGSRVMDGRRQRNPVSGVLFLSDGRDNRSFLRWGPGNIRLLPPSIRGEGAGKVPVHAFGFGLDHDAVLMSSLAEGSGGTFSFVEDEADIGEAFAQCLGGLMTVTVQDLRVSVECVDPGVTITGAIRSGGYASRVREDDRRAGSIDVGDMYAGESRDFLLQVNVPTADVDVADYSTTLLKLATVHTEPVSKAKVESEEQEVRLARPVVLRDEDRIACLEVVRQRKRYEAAEAMAAARAAADQGQFGQAVSTLDNCREALFGGSTPEDEMTWTLDAEMRELRERMGDLHTYERFGRAYALAGLSSHLQQRATARSSKPTTSEGMFGTSAAFGSAAATPFGEDVQAGAPPFGFGAAPQGMFGSASGNNTVTTFQSLPFQSSQPGAPRLLFGSTAGQAPGWGSPQPTSSFGASFNTTTSGGLFRAAPLQAPPPQMAAGTHNFMGQAPQGVLGTHTTTTTSTGSGIVESPYLTPAMERLMRLARTGQSPLAQTPP